MNAAIWYTKLGLSKCSGVLAGILIFLLKLETSTAYLKYVVENTEVCWPLK